MNCSPPGSSVCSIFQARIMEWVAISFSRESLIQVLNPHLLHWQADSLPLSHLGSPNRYVSESEVTQLCLTVTPWTVAYQVPPSMGFSRQECWSGVPLPSPSHVALAIKKPICQCRRHIKKLSSVSGSEKSSGGGNGNPLQYCCLENPMGRGTWRATVHGITKSQT